ncbi:MAG TPA: Fic family protein, partial [Burkholderiaceae bacterium]|nr:Fic family protein [Burkholderiaceae bacterium]
MSAAPTDPLPRALFDSLAEPVLAFDGGARLQYANPVALRGLPIEPGMLLADLGRVFDASWVDWLRSSRDHPLIASAVFHYEFEFIHPFADGNGRMGRLWQTLLLSRWRPL